MKTLTTVLINYPLAIDLNGYDVIFRYPGHEDEPTDEEVEQAITHAGLIYSYVLEKVEK